MIYAHVACRVEPLYQGRFGTSNYFALIVRCPYITYIHFMYMYSVLYIEVLCALYILLSSVYIEESLIKLGHTLYIYKGHNILHLLYNVCNVYVCVQILKKA